MIVCVCHKVSDRAIASEVRAGCSSFEELQEALRVATACGACADCALDTFERLRDDADAGVCCAVGSGRDRAVVRIHASIA